MQRYGIIPTRMGTRIICIVSHSTIQDHPHAYGDKLFIYKYKNFVVGSSPRVWGQAAIQLQFASLQRDHPHACGDKRTKITLTRLAVGSSPRVWGQVASAAYGSDRSRIIPTRVGTSFRSLFERYLRQDHPHACGDKHLPVQLE